MKVSGKTNVQKTDQFSKDAVYGLHEGWGDDIIQILSVSTASETPNSKEIGMN